LLTCAAVAGQPQLESRLKPKTSSWDITAEITGRRGPVLNSRPMSIELPPHLQTEGGAYSVLSRTAGGVLEYSFRPHSNPEAIASNRIQCVSIRIDHKCSNPYRCVCFRVCAFCPCQPVVYPFRQRYIIRELCGVVIKNSHKGFQLGTSFHELDWAIGTHT
jgi:hypothetical protein